MRNTITVTCLFCSGTGAVLIDNHEPRTCPTCKGSGLVDVVEDSSNQTKDKLNEQT